MRSHNGNKNVLSIGSLVLRLLGAQVPKPTFRVGKDTPRHRGNNAPLLTSAPADWTMGPHPHGLQTQQILFLAWQKSTCRPQLWT
ncbi:hypothetical protein F5B20DRAFT_540148 [Whalleya microplaca]|nr:hypothetical protein F5B20DRAFT_540148 [Whalleya microplaca]